MQNMVAVWAYVGGTKNWGLQRPSF